MSQADVPLFPEIVHHFQGDEGRGYLVKKYIKLRKSSPPDLPERTAKAPKYLSMVPAPSEQVMGPLEGGRIRPGSSPLTATTPTMSPTTSDRDRSTGLMPPPPGMTTSLVYVDGSDLRPTCAIGPNLSSCVVIIWHQGKAKINRLFGSGSSESRTTHEPTCRFPPEIVEMTVAQFEDLGTLKACSLACRSWYIVAVPRIHRTLILTGETRQTS